MTNSKPTFRSDPTTLVCLQELLELMEQAKADIAASDELSHTALRRFEISDKLQTAGVKRKDADVFHDMHHRKPDGPSTLPVTFPDGTSDNRVFWGTFEQRTAALKQVARRTLTDWIAEIKEHLLRVEKMNANPDERSQGTSPDPEWVEGTPSELAKMFDVQWKTVKRRIEAGKIVATKVNEKRWRIRKDFIPE